jgi:ATP-dependent protease HslVU (ClpYQ) peptidase subunit
MTCIAAVVTPNGQVVMGGDSASVDDQLRIDVGKEAKVWHAGPLLFGACGSFRVAQVLRWHLTVPTPEPDDEPLAYLTGPLARAMREALAENGALTTWDEDNTEGLTESGLLIGYAGQVYEVYEDFGVHQPADDYAAVGCGRRWAEGVMWATKDMDIKPKRRVGLALAAAEKHSAGVVGPMEILSQP